MSEQFTQQLLDLMGQLDYVAIGILMAAESTFLPVPSELVMIPAGYLASQGTLNPWLIMVASSTGSLAGSLVSYYVALWLGRPLLLRFGRYVFVTREHLEKTEMFVKRHGEISIFTGRFIPGVRHLISMPAGLVRMRIVPFMAYTLIGASLWNAVLLVLGYVIQAQQTWLEDHFLWVVAGTLCFAGGIVTLYVIKHRRHASVPMDPSLPS